MRSLNGNANEKTGLPCRNTGPVEPTRIRIITVAAAALTGLGQLPETGTGRGLTPALAPARLSVVVTGPGEETGTGAGLIPGHR